MILQCSALEYMIVGKEGDRPAALVHMVTGQWSHNYTESTIWREYREGIFVQSVKQPRARTHNMQIEPSTPFPLSLCTSHTLTLTRHSECCPFTFIYSIFHAFFLFLHCSSSVEKLKGHVCKGNRPKKVTLCHYDRVYVSAGKSGRGNWWRGGGF